MLGVGVPLWRPLQMEGISWLGIRPVSEACVRDYSRRAYYSLFQNQLFSLPPPSELLMWKRPGAFHPLPAK